MALIPGTRLGPYEILALLGAGGMGQVYRARDTTLGRDVALKVLPEAFAHDAERLARFQREAKTLAALNHPHIAIIHGFEQTPSTGSGQAGVHALVMELIEGDDLSARIARGALPLDEALPIARQIAEALEAAHGQGIIHRDLKPANIKVRADGTVKVLDFGLAKALAPVAASDAEAAGANAATITSPAMTQAGMILGTAAYMSPEQAKGHAVDKRSDVWAFGCVLYEMLSGQRAFKGEDVADTLALVLKGGVNFDALPSSVPPAVGAVIRGCLHKDRNARIGDIAAALFVLRQPPDGEPVPSGRPLGLLWRRAALVLAGVLASAVFAAAMLWPRGVAAPAAVTRFVYTLPPDQQLTIPRRAVALSPDGTQIVYGANGELFVRLLSEFEARVVPGIRGVAAVFSPDGEALAFYADSAIKRVAVAGGTAVTLCPVSIAPTGLSWTNGQILFSDGGETITRVSENGGTPEVLVDLSGTEELAFTPQLLPDGDTLLLTMIARKDASLDRWDAAQVVAQSLRTRARKPLIHGAFDAQYVPTGHIVYMSDGSLFAVPFDLPSLTVTEAPCLSLKVFVWGRPRVSGALRTLRGPARGHSRTCPAQRRRRNRT